MLGKGNQRFTLCGSCLLVNQHDRLCRIRIGIWISERCIGLYRSDYGEPIEFLSVPASVAHMPGKQRLVAHKSDLAICEALRDIHIGAAAFEVITGDFLSLTREGKSAQSRYCEENSD